MRSSGLTAVVVVSLAFLACGQGAGSGNDAAATDVGAAEVIADARGTDVTGKRCEGDRWVASPADVGPTADCVVIGGNLSVTGNALVDVRLPNLEAVEGFLTVWGNPALEFFAAPSLASIGGYLDVSSNQLLGTVVLPELATVNARGLAAAQDVLFSDNPRIGCQDQAIATQLREKGWKGSIRIVPGNPLCTE